MYFITIKIKLPVQMYVIALSPVGKAFREPSGHRTGRLAFIWGIRDASQGNPVITPQCPECLSSDEMGRPRRLRPLSAANLPPCRGHNSLSIYSFAHWKPTYSFSHQVYFECRACIDPRLPGKTTKPLPFGGGGVGACSLEGAWPMGQQVSARQW